ncbi:FABP family protein [Corynebacterium sp.]|uniref:FABP family protein n=1 Tax=Corynebacterium sp. TaxID=1720 RepID=UPI0026DF3B12|nr:FABP family protein [Corynebacterium sp.]MDO5513550.1 FABP family protein [Corynebacterium sp.]
MNLHPLAQPLEFLLGSWSGPGRGHFPTISDFNYTETITFAAIPGKPFLRYEQVTSSPEGAPMHTELGFLRLTEGGSVEFIIAQPTGQAELLEGTSEELEDGTLLLHFDASQVHNSSTAKRVDGTTRTYIFNAHRTAVHTEFDMAAVDQPMQRHLISDLSKV